MTAESRIGDVHYATDGRDILFNKPDGWEVDQPWLWWDGPADGDGTGGPWGNPPPGAEMAAPTMYGMSLPAVTRCTQLLTESIAGMPWKTYRGRDLIKAPAWIIDPQLQRLDQRVPGANIRLDVRFSPVEFWGQAITSYLWWGEALIFTPRQLDADGQPTGPIVAPVYLLHPNHVDLDDDGQWYVEDDDLGTFPIDARELLVVRNLTRPGRKRGLGVIQAHAADLGFAANLRGYMDNLFQRGVPNGYLKSTKPDLDGPAAKKLKDAWMKAHGATRKSIAVLNATTSFEPLDIDPQAAQFVELLRLQAWQVALMFGVPPNKLGINMGQSNTYQNLEADNLAFVQDSLLPIARKFEAAIDALLPQGTSLKIDFRQIMRGDTSSRYAAYQTGLDPATGFLTTDEVREAEDLPQLVADPEADTDPAVSLAFDLVKGAPSLANTPGLAVLVEQIRAVLSDGTEPTDPAGAYSAPPADDTEQEQ